MSNDRDGHGASVPKVNAADSSPAIQPFSDINALSLMARRNPTADASAPAAPSGTYGEFSVRR